MSFDVRPGKLVRDALSARIPADEIRIATDPSEIGSAIAAKIGEDLAKLAGSDRTNPTDYADLIEAVEACAARHGVPAAAIAAARAAERAEHGAFERRLIWTPPSTPPMNPYDQRPRLARLSGVLGDAVVASAAAAAGSTPAVDFGGWLDLADVLLQGLRSLRQHGAPLLQGLDDEALGDEVADLLRHGALNALAAACADAPPGHLAAAAARIERTAPDPAVPAPPASAATPEGDGGRATLPPPC